jgi:hypothetical protein
VERLSGRWMNADRVDEGEGTEHLSDKMKKLITEALYLLPARR